MSTYTHISYRILTIQYTLNVLIERGHKGNLLLLFKEEVGI